jgi:hypothetical protein
MKQGCPDFEAGVLTTRQRISVNVVAVVYRGEYLNLRRTQLQEILETRITTSIINRTPLVVNYY